MDWMQQNLYLMFSLKQLLVSVAYVIHTAYTVTFVHLLGVQHVLATTRDPDKLLHTWKHYQERFSSKIEEYLDILQLTNVAAKANGEN
jgi:hypothetical protein